MNIFWAKVGNALIWEISNEKLDKNLTFNGRVSTL